MQQVRLSSLDQMSLRACQRSRCPSAARQDMTPTPAGAEDDELLLAVRIGCPTPRAIDAAVQPVVDEPESEPISNAHVTTQAVPLPRRTTAWNLDHGFRRALCLQEP